MHETTRRAAHNKLLSFLMTLSTFIANDSKFPNVLNGSDEETDRNRLTARWSIFDNHYAYQSKDYFFQRVKNYYYNSPLDETEWNNKIIMNYC